jgi:predicted  nucleic acid-binding Zn-ribbon protein
MTGEAQRLAGRLAEREAGFEREMERVRVAREEERGEVERLRRQVEDGERRIRELEEAVEGLTKVKVTAEKKTQIVRCPLLRGVCVLMNP